MQSFDRLIRKCVCFLTLLLAIFPCVYEVRASPLLKTFDFGATQFEEHPDGKAVYVSSGPTDTVYRINLNTLEVEQSFFAGDSPSGLAFSDDGSRLFIANRGESVSVVDTNSGTIIDSIPLPGSAFDLEMGLNGLLFATPRFRDSDIMMIDTFNKEYVGDFGYPIAVYRSGLLQMSPDRSKLYFGNDGLSPGTLAVFDVTSETPSLVWRNRHGDLGSNGQDLALSRDGRLITYVVGAGNRTDGGVYDIAVLESEGFSVVDILDVGAYPTEGEFSPDGAVYYAVHSNTHIDIWIIDRDKYLAAPLLESYYSVATPRASRGAHELYVDPTGRRLYVAVNSELRVHDTGRRIIPEPSMLRLVFSACFGILFPFRYRGCWLRSA